MPEIIKSLIPLLIDLAGKTADAIIAGEDLSEHAKLALVSAYCELSLWGKHFAADTGTDLDDKGVAEALEFIRDTAEEAGIALPVI